MPRLGGDPAPTTGRHSAVGAYPNARRGSIWTIVSLLVFTLMLRNFFFTDYRGAEVAHLRAAGKTDAEIEQLIPKTAAERREKAVKSSTEYLILKSDVARLKKEVKELQEKLNATTGGALKVAEKEKKGEGGENVKDTTGEQKQES